MQTHNTNALTKYRWILIHRWLRSGTNRLLISDFGSLTRGERDNSYYANHPQYSAQLVVQSQFLNAMVGPQLLTIMVRPQLQLSAYMA